MRNLKFQQHSGVLYGKPCFCSTIFMLFLNQTQGQDERRGRCGDRRMGQGGKGRMDEQTDLDIHRVRRMVKCGD